MKKPAAGGGGARNADRVGAANSAKKASSRARRKRCMGVADDRREAARLCELDARTAR